MPPHPQSEYIALNMSPTSSSPPPSAATTTTTTTTAPSLQTFPSASTAKLHPYNNHRDIHIGDTATTGHITAGFFTLERGCRATTTFGFDEYKYVVEGTFVLTDGGNRHQKVTLRKGDVFFIPNGSTITFETEEEGGEAFFVAQRPLNESRRAGVGFARL